MDWVVETVAVDRSEFLELFGDLSVFGSVFLFLRSLKKGIVLARNLQNSASLDFPQITTGTLVFLALANCQQLTRQVRRMDMPESGLQVRTEEVE